MTEPFYSTKTFTGFVTQAAAMAVVINSFANSLEENTHLEASVRAEIAVRYAEHLFAREMDWTVKCASS